MRLLEQYQSNTIEENQYPDHDDKWTKKDHNDYEQTQ